MIINPSSWYYHRCHASLLNVIHFLIYIYIFIFFFCSPFCFTPCCFKKKKTRESTTAPFKMTDCSFVVGVVRHSPYLFFFLCSCVRYALKSTFELFLFFVSLTTHVLCCIVLYLFAGPHQKTSFFFCECFFFFYVGY